MYFKQCCQTSYNTFMQNDIKLLEISTNMLNKDLEKALNIFQAVLLNFAVPCCQTSFNTFMQYNAAVGPRQIICTNLNVGT